MNGVFRIFAKDGLEVLRDRRTLFVNLVLPLLLYPVIMLFMVQVLQLTQATPGEPPRVALIEAPGSLQRLMRDPAPAGTSAAEKSPSTSHRPMSSALAAAKPTMLHVVGDLPPQDAKRLSELVATAGNDPLDRSPEALALLRRNNLVAAVVVLELPRERYRLAVLQDDASNRVDEVQARLAMAFDTWRKEIIVQRLREVGLPADTTVPFEIATVGLAPAVESVRTRVAGIIPLLLVLLAASGAFYPALDLLAGERERGTLETLLSLPVRRRDIFLGKLLVACAAAAVAVILNLLSLFGSVALVSAQIPAGATSGVDVSGLFAVGGGTLLLCFVVLLPLVVTLAAVALAITGLAHSAKEAQNYLTPLLLVVLVAAAVAAIPGARANYGLDLVPITGVVLALKEALQSPRLPWLHLGLATAASLTLAAVVVAWSSRLLESERFRYPGLVRAGWGRFRRWGAAPTTPGGLEALAVYAVAVAGMTMGAGFFAGSNVVTMVATPLLLFIGVPALLHAWLGAYRPSAIYLTNPGWRGITVAVLFLPAAIALSGLVGNVQQALVGKELMEQGGEQIHDVINGIRAQGGLVLLLLCVAVLPGISEELLCRGTLLAGLRNGIGPIGAALVSAFLFAVLHLSPYRFAPQFCLGVMLAVLVWRTRSIVPAMIIHAGHNGVLVLLELYASKSEPPAWMVGALALVAVVFAAVGWRLSATAEARQLPLPLLPSQQSPS